MPRRFVVQADGGSRGNPGPAGYGAVIVDGETGEVLREIAEYIGEATNNVAEYQGLIAGLTAAHALDANATIDVRMDSKLVIEQMSGRWQIKHPNMRELAKEARSIHDHSKITYRWIPREENSHADRLANEAMDAEERGQAWTAVPSGPSIEGGTLVPPVTKLNPISGRIDALGEPTTIFLVRHGETALTPSRAFSGGDGSNPPLSPHGRWQAERVAEALRGLEIATIYASPMQRTMETASAIASAIGADVRQDERLLEVRFGEWDGLHFSVVEQRDPDLVSAWLTSPDAVPPGGESYQQMAKRVDEAIADIIHRHGEERVLVVSHSTPIRHVLRQTLEAPAHSAHRLEVLPCSISVAAYWPDGTSLVRAVNDTVHLRS